MDRQVDRREVKDSDAEQMGGDWQEQTDKVGRGSGQTQVHKVSHRDRRRDPPITEHSAGSSQQGTTCEYRPTDHSALVWCGGAWMVFDQHT